MAKLSKAIQRRYGQITYYHVLKRQGKTAEAEAWAQKHKLYSVPPKDPRATLSPLATPSQAATGNPTLPLPALASTGNATAPSQHELARASTAHATQQLPAWGAGVQPGSQDQNLDQIGRAS